MANLSLILWGTLKVFSTVVASLYIPTNNAQKFQFFHILANIWYLLFSIVLCLLLNNSHPNGYEVIQFSCSVVSNSLRPHGLQYARLSCPSPTPGPCLNLCLLSQWCHPIKKPKNIPAKPNFHVSSVQSLSRVRLGNPMDCCTPVLPIHHQLLEFTQTLVHWVSDAIQPSHPLLSPSPPAFNLSQHQGLFKWVSSSHQVAKVLEFQLQHQSFQ